MCVFYHEALYCFCPPGTGLCWAGCLNRAEPRMPRCCSECQPERRGWQLLSYCWNMQGECEQRCVCGGDLAAREISTTPLKFLNSSFWMLAAASALLCSLCRLDVELSAVFSQPLECYYFTSVVFFFFFFSTAQRLHMLNKTPPVRCSSRASVLMFSAFVIKTPAVSSGLGEEAFRSCSDRAL